MNAPRFSLPEIILMTIVLGAIDIVDVLLSASAAGVLAIGSTLGLIPIAGTIAFGAATGAVAVIEGILKPLLNFITTALVQLYLYFKGVRRLHFLGGSLAEFIPVLNTLPLRTLSFLALVAVTNKAADLASAAEPAPSAEAA
jgi:hypothetical protein